MRKIFERSYLITDSLLFDTFSVGQGIEDIILATSDGRIPWAGMWLKSGVGPGPTLGNPPRDSSLAGTLKSTYWGGSHAAHRYC